MPASASPHQPRRLQKMAMPRPSSPTTDGAQPPKSNLLTKRNQGTLSTGSSQQSPRRPSPPPRNSSFSKRHASFDSPREVPLPSPSLLRSSSPVQSYFPTMGHTDGPSSPTRSRPSSMSKQRPAEEAFSPAFEEQDSGWTSVSAHPKRNSAGDQAHERASKLSLLDTDALSNPSAGSSSHPYCSPPASPGGSSRLHVPPSGPGLQIHPFPRPYSLPHSHSGSIEGSSTSYSHSPTEDGTYQAKPPDDASASLTAPGIDRSSSASLPLPSQIPFYTLPKVGALSAGPTPPNGSSRVAVSDVARSGTAQTDEDKPAPTPAPPSSGAQGGDSSENSSSSSLPRVGETHVQAATPMAEKKVPSPLPLHSSPQSSQTYPHLRDPPHRYSPPSSYPHSSYASAPPSAYATALYRRPLSSSTTSSASSLPPPEPPTILPTPDSTGIHPEPQQLQQARSGVNSYRSSNASTTSGASVLSSFSQASIGTGITSPEGDSSPSLPSCPPDPSGSLSPNLNPNPALMQNYRSPSRQSSQRSSQGSQNEVPPYMPFLSHAPPPADSWIEVETTPGEYRLNVRLPGFTRDGITLATKRRRILHVVADSWENDGGHFERRISFGYDADLVQVRAEFDGEMLRVVVPRRVPPVMFGGSRSGMGF